MNDERTAAYRFKITAPNSSAWLKLGATRKDVEVVEMSRDSFTVRLKGTLGKRIAVGKEFRLFYQETLWAVICKSKWIGQGGLVDVEFEAARELTEPKLEKNSGGSRTMPIATTNPMDGMLAFSFLIVILLCVLILPAWGGKWGTSQVICEAVNNVCNVLYGLLSGRSS